MGGGDLLGMCIENRVPPEVVAGDCVASLANVPLKAPMAIFTTRAMGFLGHTMIA